LLQHISQCSLVKVQLYINQYIICWHFLYYRPRLSNPLPKFVFIFLRKMFVKCQINATFAVRFPKGLPRRSETQLLNTN
jgi:hypothetical protein